MNIPVVISRSLFILFTPLLIGIYAVHPTKRVATKAADTTRNTYANPVVPGDFPDPSVIRAGSTYYASGTSSEFGPHFPLFVSKDLVNWKQKGYIFKTKPSWALSSFWAPELFYHNETYYVYYVAKRASDKVACIGVATSTNPEKGFTDQGVIINYGTESIDPFVFEDKGKLFIIWKAYGLDKRPIELLASQISADGLHAVGDPFSLLRDDKHTLMEGASMLKKDGYYYLFYSAGGCCGVRCSYNVRVARATAFEGPYTNFEGNPILTANEKWKCPGHGTFVETPTGKYYFLYHAYNVADNIYTGRQGMLDELAWDATTKWPYFKNGNSPSIKAESPLKAKQILHDGMTDNFTQPVLADFWQWDYRHSKPIMQLKKGQLCLAGEIDTVNHTGTALTVRPESGTYEMRTEVLNTNPALKGLVLYGDVNHAIGIGVTGNTVQLWEVTNKERKIWSSTEIKTGKPVQFKMTVTDRTNFKFYWGQEANSWNELNQAASQSYDGRLLPAWDRSARPGLHHYGKTDEQACFSWFKITYTK